MVFVSGNQQMLEKAIKTMIQDKVLIEKMKLESKKIISGYNFLSIAEAIEAQV
jgi:hypothetical protein